MPVFQFNPLTDPRWDALASGHARASIFHSSGWLRALQMSYGYQPVAYTLTSPGSELENAILFCRVSSWATASRLVSLPFSDHCEPLVSSDADAIEILRGVLHDADVTGVRTVELRPNTFGSDLLRSQLLFGNGDSFSLHQIDLRPSEDQLIRSFDKDCIQRRIRHAEKEGMLYREGYSEELLKIFFHLLLKTRRKHRLPPQPITWFRNLADFLGDRLRIRVLLKEDSPVAAILTLRWKDTVTYKYSCSDPDFSKLGASVLLLWKAIQEEKQAGLNWFDLGRSDLDNPGLVKFKSHWGATHTTISYWEFPAPTKPQTNHSTLQKVAGQFFEHMPDRFLITAGRLLYRHMG